MDKTKDYRKMCDCFAIQNQWLKLAGRIMPFDFCWIKVAEIALHVLCCNKANTGNYLYFGQGYRNFERRECIWLPRQDQLQRMLSWYWDLLGRGERYHLKLWNGFDGIQFTGKTAEQALIRGVLYELKKKGGVTDGSTPN